MVAIGHTATPTQTSTSSSSACLISKSGAGAQPLTDNTFKGHFKKACPQTTAVSCMIIIVIIIMFASFYLANFKTLSHKIDYRSLNYTIACKNSQGRTYTFVALPFAWLR